LWSNLSLRVPPGQMVAVLGPNGAGKSTFLRMLLGIHPTVAGSVQVLGEAPGRNNRAIGYLPQRRSFDHSLRIRGVDLVRMGLDGDRWGVPLPLWLHRREARETELDHRARVARAVEQVGGTHFARRPVGEVSGGEQQRLLIAQALVREPRLLLLDEPLESLDIPSQQTIAALLRQVCAAGVTVVIVAHDVNPILSTLDQVVYVARGQALAGPPRDVITAANLSKLYGTAIEVLHRADGAPVVVGQPDAVSTHTHVHLH
jgi:zinc/manganese transport system ATP-binding protein